VAAVLLVLLPLLAGCWDRTELDDTAFAMSVGIDEAGDEFLWTFRFFQAERVQVGMLAATPQPQLQRFGLVTVRGRNLEQAVQLAQTGAGRIVSLEQLRIVVIGEAVAKRGVGSLLDQLVQHNQVRRGAAMVMARGRAGEMFAAYHPLEHETPLKYVEGILLVAKRVHQTPYTRIQHFYGRYLSPGADPFLFLVAVKPPEERQQPPDPDLPPMSDQSRLAGDLPKAGGNPLEFAGTAVFRRDRLAGLLSVDETAALLALRGEMGKVYASVPDPLAPGQQVAFRFHQENKPKYWVSFQRGRPVVHVRIQLEAEIISMTGTTLYREPTNRHALEAFTVDHLRRTIYVPMLRKVYGEWGADAVGFGDMYRTQFPTFDAFLDYRWHDHIRELQADVTIDLFIRRFGMVIHHP
jgi:spore germination protein KC